MPNFRSDNETPVAMPIMAALEAANQGTAHAYADDEWSGRLDAAFSDLFETPTRVLPVVTGTVANSIALATVTPPWGSVLCHRNAHIYCDEGGCPEFYGNGLRLVAEDGTDGKLHSEAVAERLDNWGGHGIHASVPAALSLTQATENGTVYDPAELKSLCTLARERGMATHMDGARFANAVASLDCAPADITWRAGVQMLSFGASKNGCMAAEALLFFDPQADLATAERLRKRGGHLLSKMRYISAQLLAYVEDGLWLELAGHANRQAARFAEAVDAHPQARLMFPVEANEVFVAWTPAGLEGLRAQGVEFHLWPGHDDLARFVFGHSTGEADVDQLIAALGA